MTFKEFQDGGDVGTPERKEWDRVIGPYLQPNWPQVKQILSCQQVKYDRSISLKAAAESAPLYHPQEFHAMTAIFTLNAPIATKVVCYFHPLKCFRSLYGKQCGPRSDCSYRSSLFWVHAVCFYT